MPKFIFPDGSSVRIPDGVDPEVATRNILKQFAGKHGLPEDAGEKVGLTGDLKAAALSGLSSVFAGLPGVIRAGIGGDWNNPWLQRYRYETETIAPSYERASTQKMREEATKAIEKAGEEGASKEFLEAVKQYGGSRLGILSAVQSLPGMLAGAGVGGLAGRGITAALPSLAGRKAAISAAGAVGSEAVMEGAEAAGETYRAVYEEAIKKGLSPEEANRIADSAAKKSAAASAGVTATLGALPIPSAEKLLAGRLAGEAPGKMFGKVPQGRIASSILGAAGEIPAEMAQAATSSIGVQRGLQELLPEEERTTEQLLKGVGGAMGQAVVGAGLIGGGAGFLSGGRRPPPPAPAAETPPAPGTEAPPVPPAGSGAVAPSTPPTPPAPPSAATGPAVPPPPAVVMTPQERQAQRASYKEQIAQLETLGLPPETIAQIKAEIGGKLNNKTPSIANLEAVGEILKKYQPEGGTNVPGTPANVPTGVGVGVGVAGGPTGGTTTGSAGAPPTGSLGGTNVPPVPPQGGAGAGQPSLTVEPGEEPVAPDEAAEARRLFEKFTTANQQLPVLEQEFQRKMRVLQNLAYRAKDQADRDPIEAAIREERNNYQTQKQIFEDDIAAYRDKFQEAVGGVEKGMHRGYPGLQNVQNPEAKNAVVSTDYPSLISALKKSPNRFVRWVASKAANLPNTISPTPIPKFAGAAGRYNFITSELSFHRQYQGNEGTITHELLHSLSANAIRNPNPSQKPIIKSLEKLFKAVAPEINKRSPSGDDYGASTLDEFISDGLSKPQFQLWLMEIPYENTSAWGKFTQLIGNLLGIRPEDKNAFTELINLTDQLAQTKAPKTTTVPDKTDKVKTEDEGVLESPISPAPKKPRTPAQQAAAQKMREAGEARRAAKKAAKEAEAQRRAANLIAPSLNKIDQIRRKFQNVQIALYNISDAVKEKLGGILPSWLDLASALSLGKGEQAANFERYAGNLERRYTTVLETLTKQMGVKVGEAARQIGNYMLARHELERRSAIFYEKRSTLTEENEASRTFLLSAIVANDKELAKLKKDFKADIKTPEQQRIYDLVDQSQNRAMDLYQEVINIVNNDPVARTLDFNATTYDVVAYENDKGEEVKMTPQERDRIIAEMEAKFSNVEIRKAVEEAIEVQKKLDKAIQEMNKLGNYTSKGAARLMEARNWQSYVPQRGVKKEDSDFEYYGETGSSGLGQSETATGGRASAADNVVTRTIVEAKKAAGRAPGNRLATIIRNYVAEGYIQGKISKSPLTTLDNYILGKSTNRGDDIVLYRDDDGEIYEVKIDNETIANAIQAKTHELIPVAKPLAATTMFMAQSNTRFSPMFWLKNFFVDPLTNTFIIGSEKGLKAATQYATTVVSDLLDSRGTSKSMNFIRLYNKGELDQISELAAKDAWYRDALEYVNIGGRISYLSGLRNETQAEQMYKKLGPGKIIRTAEQLAAFTDIANEGLELALRVSAFRSAKSFPEFEGDVRKAAAYAKDLANFEQMGQWGKWMGAWFMFSRPSATGASRLYDALSKGKYAKEAVATAAIFGTGIYFLSMLMSGDDDEGRNKIEHDDPARWVRNWRMFIPGFESPIQIPWGFGLGSFAAASAQLSMFLFGKSTAKEFAGNMKTIASEALGLPISQMSFLKNPAAFILDSITPAPAKPLLQMVADTDSLERAVFHKGQTKYANAYMGGENIPESVKAMGETMFDVFKEVLPESVMKVLSPDGLHFLGNNYLGGLYRTMSQMDSNIRATGVFNENEQKDINVIKATILLAPFVGTAANYDLRQYGETRKEIEQYKKVLRTYKDQAPEKYAQYREDHPGRERAVKYFESQENSALRDLREQANAIKRRYRDAPKDREEALKENLERQNAVMRRMVERTRELLED